MRVKYVRVKYVRVKYVRVKYVRVKYVRVKYAYGNPGPSWTPDLYPIFANPSSRTPDLR